MKKSMQSPVDFHEQMEALDDVVINPSTQPHLNDVINRHRRSFLKGGLGITALGFLGGSLAACERVSQKALLGFTGVPAQFAADFDTVTVPPGYRAQPLFSWGDKVLADAPQWQEDASDHWQAQLGQSGDNHDGMHFFPLEDDPDNHGLLVMNHEYSNPVLHPDGPTWVAGKRPFDEVRKEQAAHGVSIIEIIRDKKSGQWQRVFPSAYNRRITALTPMRIAGPLAGHEAMKTRDDPEGLTVFGTINNCSMGFTPWGTYLTCEENWHNYFVNRDSDDHAGRRSHKRYGIANAETSRSYGWETADPRFDATPDPDSAHGGYVNEPHRFGWVVEIDPFDPTSTPVKRTAFGRYCRECSVLSLTPDGRMAFYSGDDALGEYVYKFVPEGRFRAGDKAHNSNLLDRGTLYAAQFLADGSGRWLPLVFGQPGLTPADGFTSQEDVLIDARSAADVLGATPMDRPEWLAVHPDNRSVYVTLTNNHLRGDRFPINAANPRANNVHGQIVRWDERDGDPAATEFSWEIFLLAGEAAGAKDASGQPVPGHLTGTIRGDLFSSPDGLAFDKAGRLWIQTDFDENSPHMASMGCNQLLCADPVTRDVRRFLVGPRGCEITGITWNPSHTAMWVNVQHPALSYPASDGVSRPRSTTVLITREDGGVIGS
jgi:secreted PhoX family phosphatase